MHAKMLLLFTSSCGSTWEPLDSEAGQATQETDCPVEATGETKFCCHPTWTVFEECVLKLRSPPWDFGGGNMC